MIDTKAWRFVALVVASSLAMFAGAQAEETDEAATPNFSPAILVQFAVSDLDSAVEFYENVVGLEMQTRIEALRWVRFKTAIPGVILGIGEQETVEGSGTVSLNLGVTDLDAMRALLESRGVEFAGPTETIPNVVKLADFFDPDGNKIRLAGPP